MSEKKQKRLLLQMEQASVIKHYAEVLRRLADANVQYADWVKHDADVRIRILDLEEAEG